MKPVLNDRSQKVRKLVYHLMQVKSIAESAILSTFIKLPFVIKTSVLSFFLGGRLYRFYGTAGCSRAALPLLLFRCFVIPIICGVRGFLLCYSSF